MYRFINGTFIPLCLLVRIEFSVNKRLLALCVAMVTGMDVLTVMMRQVDQVD